MSMEECAEHGMIGCRDAACYTAPPEPKLPAPTGFRRGGVRPPVKGPIIHAQFESTCSECGGDILEGDEITPNEEERLLQGRPVKVKIGSGWRHVECP